MVEQSGTRQPTLSRIRGAKDGRQATPERPRPVDAAALADLVRTDRHRHRLVRGDSGLAEAVKVLARGHQQLVWARQRQANMLRSALRALYPSALAAFGSDPGGRDAAL